MPKTEGETGPGQSAQWIRRIRQEAGYMFFIPSVVGAISLTLFSGVFTIEFRSGPVYPQTNFISGRKYLPQKEVSL